MRFPAALARLLSAPANDEETNQKGVLIQAIVFLLGGAALLTAVFTIIRSVTQPDNIPTSLLYPGFLLLLPAAGSIWLARRGQPQLAAHLFFIPLNLAVLALAPTTASGALWLYLLLISVVAIPFTVSARAGLGYTAVIILASLTLFLLNQLPTFTLAALFIYLVITLGLSLTAGLSAHALRQARHAFTNLVHEQKAQTNLLQRRAQQLQRSAAVSQAASATLDPASLLHETVQTVGEQFGFYFVAIYLLDDAQKFLTLREATGAIGEEMKQRQYQVDLESTSIVGWVAKHQQARIARDVFDDPVFFNEPLLRDTRSELALPLQAHGNVLGVLDVQSEQTDAFSADDIAILQIMANQVAVHIDNAQLFARTEQHLSETQTLLTLSTNLAATMDVGEIYRRAARTFARQLTAVCCIIYQQEAHPDQLVSQITYQQGENGRGPERFNFNPHTYTLSEAPHIAQALATGNALTYQRHDPDLTEAEQTFLQANDYGSSLIAPLIHGDQSRGLVQILRHPNQPAFHPDDAQLSQLMANQTAIALHNARLASEARGRVAQLNALNRLSNTITLAPTLHGIFEGVRREIFSLFEATAMSVVLLTPDGQHLDWIYGYEYGQEIDLSNIPLLDISQGFSGQVVRSRQHLLINRRFSEMAAEYQSITVGAMSNTWLGFPLIAANKLIGVLAIENENDSDAFGERDVALLETIAGTVAIAINNYLQFEAVQNALAAQSAQRNQLQTAAEVAAATTDILDLDQLLERAVTLIRERFALYYAGLFLIDQESNQAILKAGTGEAGRVQLQRGHRLAVGGHSLIGGATADGQPRITQDVTQEAEWQPNPHLPATRSELAIPLRVRGQIIGALTVQSTEPHAFSPELISTLQTVSDQLAVALENARLLAAAEHNAEQQKELNQISARLHNTADVDAILQIGLQAIAARVKGQQVSLSLGAQPGNADYPPTPPTN